MTDKGLKRRSLLTAGTTAVVAASAVAAVPTQAMEIHGKEPWQPHQADLPQPVQGPDYLFFTRQEAAFVEAASERLIPADDLGPGARDCGVALFIDHQLAGPYGRAQGWYMQGPWDKGTDTQGFQSRLNPAGLYRAAIRAIEAKVGSAHQGKPFAGLAPTDQDQVLTDLEAGKLDLDGVDGSTFFKMLMINTKEGIFSDPIYGGNKDMAGWKMIGFPGARYDYREWVGRHGERFDLPPVGIQGRLAWTSKS